MFALLPLISRTGPNVARPATCVTTALFTLVALAAPQGGRGEELAWKFSPGERFSLGVVQGIRGEVTAGERRVALDSQMALHTTWRVEETLAGGGARLAVSFDRLALRLAGMPPLEYDSAKEPAESARDIDAAVRPLVGANIEASLTRRGAIAQVAIPKETESLLRRAAASPALRQLLTREGLARLLRLALPVLPPEQADAAAPWSDEVAYTTMLGEMRTRLELRRAPPGNAEQGFAALRVVPTLQFADGKLEHTTRVLSLGEKVDVTTRIVRQEGRGEALFNAVTGRLVRAELEWELDLASQSEGVASTTKLRTAMRTTLAPLDRD